MHSSAPTPKKNNHMTPELFRFGEIHKPKNVMFNIQAEDQFATSQVAFYPIQLDITFILVSPGEGSTKKVREYVVY